MLNPDGLDPRVISEQIATLYQADARRIFATLVRLLGDFDLAEEALQDAFAAAVTQWAESGIPQNPRAWLVSAGRFKAIDTLRRRKRFDQARADLERQALLESSREPPASDDAIEDDRLRLIFTCCHPALAQPAQVALTLREVCGLRTEEIASAFLIAPVTLAQRLVRAKAKIRDAGIPYEIPGKEALPDRIDAVLQVIYLVFNEGYSASNGHFLTRADLTHEAIRLGRLLCELLPDPEVLGLTALMLLHDSRRHARTSANGDLVLLEDQDRSLWDQAAIDEGQRLVQQALASRRVGPYSIQAAIAAVHAEAKTPQETDWRQILALYEILNRLVDTPVVRLNRAVAIAMVQGPEAGLRQIDELLAAGELSQYHLAHAARADMCRRLGRPTEARQSYQRALELTQLIPEQEFLKKRIREMN